MKEPWPQRCRSRFSAVLKPINSVSSAKSSVKAAQASLLATEQDILLNAATAYLNVMRDEAIVKLQKNNEKLLKKGVG